MAWQVPHPPLVSFQTVFGHVSRMSLCYHSVYEVYIIVPVVLIPQHLLSLPHCSLQGLIAIVWHYQLRLSKWQWYHIMTVMMLDTFFYHSHEFLVLLRVTAFVWTRLVVVEI